MKFLTWDFLQYVGLDQRILNDFVSGTFTMSELLFLRFKAYISKFVGVEGENADHLTKTFHFYQKPKCLSLHDAYHHTKPTRSLSFD